MGGNPLPPKKKKTGWIVAAVLGFLALLILSQIMSAVRDSGSSSSSSSPSSSSTSTPSSGSPSSGAAAPAVGTCLRLDASEANLAEEVDCVSDEPHYRVTWTGDEADQPDECPYLYSFGASLATEKIVCLYPIFTMEECYSIGSADPEAGTERMREKTVERTMNEWIEPIACDGPPLEPEEIVVRMIGEVDGLEGEGCPPETMYLITDPTASRTSCLDPMGS